MKKSVKIAMFSAICLAVMAPYAMAGDGDEAEVPVVELSAKEKKAAEKKAKKEAKEAAKAAKMQAKAEAKESKKGTKASKSEKSKSKPEKVKAAKIQKIKFDQTAYDQAMADGDYQTCIGMLLGKDSKKSEILDSLNADMLMYIDGQYLNSAKAFMDTTRKMQLATADMSGGKAFGAAMAGENAVKYAGNVYERILSYAMRTVNAVSLGDMSNAKGILDTYTGDYKDIISALVEAEAENDKVAENSKPEDDPKTKKALAALSLAKDVNINFNAMSRGKPEKKDVKYESSDFLSYLGTLIYAANGDYDHARDFASTMKNKVDVSEDISIPAGKGRLDVVALSGRIGKRTQAEYSGNFGVIANVPVSFKVAYPEFNPAVQNHEITGVRVVLSDGSSKKAILIEDFDEAVAIDVARKAPGAYSRSVFRNIRNIALAASTIVTTGVLADNGVPGMDVANAAAIIAFPPVVNGIAKAEKADLRQGEYFPHMASAAGFTVEPGKYSAKVEYLNGGTVVETEDIAEISVEAGKTSVVISCCDK